MKRIKLNLRQLWVHFIAFWLFIGSFRYLIYLTNIRLFKILMASAAPGHFFDWFDPANANYHELMNYIIFIPKYWLFAILFALLISLIISWRKGWSWINSVIVAIMTYVLYATPFHRYEGVGWHTTIYYDPVPTTIGWFTAVGILFLVLGLALFLSPRVNKYINRGALSSTGSTF